MPRIALALVSLFALFICTLPAHAADKPNIIYILLDDAGYGDLSCYGQKKFTTPNIDRLASEGMKFTDHYSGSTVCAPTRCSLMTGKHTGRCYVRGNREVSPEGQRAMPADIITIPRLLKDAGYATGMFGKWGLGAPGSESDPMEHFGRFYGYNCQRQAHSFYPGHLWSDREKVKLDGKTYSHDLILEEAKKFIRANEKKPFFCYMSITIPHAAMQAPEEEMKPWREKFPMFEDKFGHYARTKVRNPIAGFAAMMTRMDRGVGEVLALLKELDIDKNTLVMLSSDNGPHHEGGHDPRFFDSNGPLKGHKRDLYEGGIRVPLVARWPGKIKARSTSDLPSAHWDMLPTFCVMSGATTPNSIDGISILPTLLGKPDEQGRHEFLYWEFPSQGGKQAVRWKDWKGVRKGLRKNKDAPLELYNLKDDLGETKNIAKNHPDVAKKLLGFMQKSHEPSDAFKLLQGE